MPNLGCGRPSERGALTMLDVQTSVLILQNKSGAGSKAVA